MSNLISFHLLYFKRCPLTQAFETQKCNIIHISLFMVSHELNFTSVYVYPLEYPKGIFRETGFCFLLIFFHDYAN